MTLLNCHDEAIVALGSVIDRLVGITTSVAQHHHREVGKAFEYLSHHRRVLERLRLKISRLVGHEENTQDYMGGFDSLLQNYVLPTLKIYSGDIPTLPSFKEISESRLSTIEAHLKSMENPLKDWSMGTPHIKVRVNMFPNNMMLCRIPFCNFNNEWIKYNKLWVLFRHPWVRFGHKEIHCNRFLLLCRPLHCEWIPLREI